MASGVALRRQQSTGYPEANERRVVNYIAPALLMANADVALIGGLESANPQVAGAMIATAAKQQRLLNADLEGRGQSSPSI